MPWREWIPYLQGLEPPVRRVGRLTEELRHALRASNSSVYISHDYAVKAIAKHRLQPDHFPMIELAILYGRVIHDREPDLTFFYYDTAVFGTWFKVAVKRTPCGSEVYVKTFHKITPQEVARICRKHVILRDQKA